MQSRNVKRWYWRCQWDDGVGGDRDICRAKSVRGFARQDNAIKAGGRHLKEANHYSYRHGPVVGKKTSTIHIWEE